MEIRDKVDKFIFEELTKKVGEDVDRWFVENWEELSKEKIGKGHPVEGEISLTKQ